MDMAGLDDGMYRYLILCEYPFLEAGRLSVYRRCTI